MKKIISILLFLITLLILQISNISANSVFTSENTYINTLTTKIKVNKDYTFNVEQTIDAHLYNEHGVYVSIPFEKGINQIDDIEVEGFGDSHVNTELNKNNGVVNVIMGDPDNIYTGNKKWKVSYTIKGYKNKNDNILSLSLLGAYWKLPIKQMETTVKMPEKTNWKGLRIVSGNQNINLKNDNHFSYRLNNNSLIVTGKEIPTSYGVSMGLDLPKNYWIDAASFEGEAISFIDFGIFLLAATIILWYCYGRDKKIVPIVEFYPPENMTPAELGYLIDGEVDNQDIIAMLFYFADKGYLEIDSTGKNLTINKVKDLPTNAPEYQKQIIRAFFGYKKVFNSNNLPSDFAKKLRDAKIEVQDNFEDKYEKIYNSKTKIIKWILIAITIIFIFNIVNTVLFDLGVDLSLFSLLAFMIAPFFIYQGSKILLGFKEKLGHHYPIKDYVYYFLSAMWMLGYFTFAFARAFKNGIIGLIVATILIAILSFIRFVEKRNDKFITLQAKAVGFKQFIKVAKLDQLKAIFEENPNYFYDILPYAYIFNLTEKWIDKFADFDLDKNKCFIGLTSLSTTGLTSYFDNVSNNLSSKIDVSTGSGFSSSGGSSSSGGFGGGGGGAW